MNKKILGILTCILFFGASIASSINIQIKETGKNCRGDTFYVGGNGSGNYSTIQSAINAAINGDTVFVFDDSSPYNETILINKQLNLIGENCWTTIINGSQGSPNKCVIKITEDNVTITGFTITGGLNEGDDGIYLEDSDWSNIYLNIIKSCIHHAIWIRNSEHTNIYSNIIEDNYDSIDLEYSDYNNIMSNQVISNYYRGMTLGFSNYNTFFNNTLISNGNYGISFAQTSNYNNFNNNIIMSNYNGIIIHNSFNNYIENNNITNNSNRGIFIHGSENNLIKDNNICSNHEKGIYLNRYSINNTIMLNKISLSSEGIGVNYNTNNNSIIKNTIFNNTFGAIASGQICYNNIFYLNNFINNFQHVFYENFHDNQLNSTELINYTYLCLNIEGQMGNYWDDYSGIDEDSNGIGDTNYTAFAPYKQIDNYPLMEPFENYFKENQPPAIPDIDGPTNGKINTEYNFSFNCTDLNDDLVMYYIDWGDNNTEWTDYGNSGEEIILNHSWNKKGEYIIKAKSRDICGEESDWAEFAVTMPRNKAINSLFLNFFQSHPKLFHVFRRLLGL